MIYSIGLTGNIGSGKSSVLGFFKNYGAEIISADQIAREITAPGESILETIQHYYQDDLIIQNGILNRSRLRERILASNEDKIWLEALLHPLIRKKIEHQLMALKSSYCIIEIPLLYHRQDYPYLHRILLVQASEVFLIQRIMNRDQCTREHAVRMLALQPDQSERLSLADDVIINDGDLRHCEAAVKKLDRQYRQAAKLWTG